MKKYLFYGPGMVATNPKVPTFSRSWEKPKLFVEQALVDPYIGLVSVEPYLPATPGMIKLAHDHDYVDDVLIGARVNGFGNCDRGIADSCLHTCGGMVDATIRVLRDRALGGGAMACVPVSGFHHAAYAHGGGFCTFNGLMVATMMALKHGARSVGIFDADQHYGDGTDSIIMHHGLMNNRVRHWTTGAMKYEPEAFLRSLRRQLLHRFQDVAVLLYQAGADCHVDDPLGGWMTTEQMRQRDQIVFDFCAEYSIPLVWDLAGGYQNPYQRVLDLHLATWAEFVRAGT